MSSEKLLQRLSQSYGSQEIMLASSGTSAVELALRGVNVGREDEVLLAAYDFKANFTNISILGAVPVLVDIRSDDAQLDATKVTEAISSKTKAILTSHLHGGVVAIERLSEIADAHGIALIEDCCQISPAATLNGRTLGCFGDVAALSFGGSKLLSAGRGGAVISHRAEIAQRIKLYQERGNSAYPLSEMQAAVLLPQLDTLSERHQVRLQFIDALQKKIMGNVGLSLFNRCEGSQTDFYKLGFWYDQESFAGLSRHQFCSAMRAEGVPIDPGFSALHNIHAKRRFQQSAELHNATRAHDDVVILHHPYLLGGGTHAELFFDALDKLRNHATMIKEQFASGQINITL